MVKSLFKLLIPISLTGLMLFPSLALQRIESDPVSLQSDPPSRSALLSNRYTQMETDARVVDENLFADLDGYTFRKTFGYLSFYDKISDASFRIVDERSGYVWASSVDYDYFIDEDSPLADPDDIGLNLYWQSKLRSPFFLTYYSGLNLREEHAFENFRSELEVTRFDDGDAVGMNVAVSLFLSKITFNFTVVFNEAGLTVTLPFESIVESEEFKISSVSFYPMFGATKRLRTPGYVVIPDGVGALIRYNDDPTIGVFSKRFFGSDVGLNQTSSEQPLFANMYGITHGHRQHALLAIVEDGAGHAILTHYGSQVYLDFNFTYVTFNYRSTYVQYLNQAKTSSVNLLQADANEINATMHYRFLNGADADYVGIGKAFGAWLFEDDRLTPTSSKIPLHLDVLALESKPGLFAREKVVMTDLSSLDDIIYETKETITEHLVVSYLGWQRGGYSYTAPNYTSFDDKLGSIKQLKRVLENNASNEDLTLMFAADPYRAYRNGTGYRQNEIMQTIGQEFINQGDYYYLTAAAGTNRLEKALNTIESWDIPALALETVGSFASSSFGTTPLSKNGMIKAMQAIIKDNPRLSVYQPYSYLWTAENLLDMPMYSSQQARFTDTVPLLPIIVSGRRHAFGRAGNFFSNTTNELLRMVDYGLYPAFFVTEKSAYELIDTPSEHIFTSCYVDWKPEIKRQYDFIAGALDAVYGKELLVREVLALGVIKITYEDEISLIVNYGGTSYVRGTIDVDPMSYEVYYGA